MNKKLLKGIKVGSVIVLTCLIAGLVVFKPALSQAIDLFSNVDQGLISSVPVEADPNAPLTDHPEGRLVSAIVADALGPISNEDLQAAVQGSETAQETPLVTNDQDEGAILSTEGTGMEGMNFLAEPEGINALSSVYVLPSADFRSDGADPDGFFFWFGGGHIMGKDDQTSGTCLMAPVYLPAGATITDVYATVVDDSDTLRIWMELYRLDNYSGDVVEVAYLETTAGYANPSLVTIYDLTISNPVVSYPSYSYYVGTCIPGSAIKLYDVRIYYE